MYMVRFDRTDETGPVFVNPELVRAVYEDSTTGETRIRFDHEHGVTVNGKPEDVVKALDNARRT